MNKFGDKYISITYKYLLRVKAKANEIWKIYLRIQPIFKRKKENFFYHVNVIFFRKNSRKQIESIRMEAKDRRETISLKLLCHIIFFFNLIFTKDFQPNREIVAIDRFTTYLLAKFEPCSLVENFTWERSRQANRLILAQVGIKAITCVKIQTGGARLKLFQLSRHVIGSIG